ncbi:MAG: hypothetical protein CMM18_04520 [Rhodospirillaceae bacterium]|nr:hypothetical protein [Rhodospirillaceae bacterium]
MNENRYFSWRIGVALLISGATSSLVIAMSLWWYFAIGKEWLSEIGLSILILPAMVILMIAICFFWFWVFSSLATLLGADEE